MAKGSSNVQYFENIPAVPKIQNILSRLGYRSGVTMLNSTDSSLVENAISQGKYLCKPMGAYTIEKISERSNCEVVLENGMRFNSVNLSNFLKNSDEVVLMAATVGKDVTEKVYQEVKSGDAARAVIIDSVASQTADAAVGWIAQTINRMLAREGRKLTKARYSPGFGDLSLSYQKEIFEVLQLDRLDMSITEKYMLVPEKSVIAIAGVEKMEA